MKGYKAKKDVWGCGSDSSIKFSTSALDTIQPLLPSNIVCLFKIKVFFLFVKSDIEIYTWSQAPHKKQK